MLTDLGWGQAGQGGRALRRAPTAAARHRGTIVPARRIARTGLAQHKGLATLCTPRSRLALRGRTDQLARGAVRAGLTLGAVRPGLTLGTELTWVALRIVRAWRPLHAVRTWLALGTVRTRLPGRTVTARPGETSGGGVPGCRRVSGNRAVSWHGPGGSAGPCKSSRPESARPESAGCRSTGSWSARCWRARSGETALARERTRTGKRTGGRGTPVTWECAIGGEVSGAGEWPLGCVRVLGRARRVSVRRAVSRTAAGRAIGGPAGRIGFAALGRDDQAAGCVDGSRSQDPLSIGVDVGNRPGAVRDVGAGERALTRVRVGRARGRADVAAGPRGPRGERSRPGRPGWESARRNRSGARPVH